MRKTAMVARREFLSTVMTKGFVVGVLVLPLVMLGVIMILPLIISSKPPKVAGTIAVVDRSGHVAELIQKRLARESLEAELRLEMRKNMNRAGRVMSDFLGSDRSGAAMGMAARQAEGMVNAPEIHLQVLAPTADIEKEKEPLRGPKGGPETRLALVVIEEGAMTPVIPEGEVEEAAPYQAFVRTLLDERVQDIVLDQVREAIIDARIMALNVEPAAVRAISEIPSVPARTVTEAGERPNVQGMQYLVPVAFMLLLMISSFTGGQYLLTTTIEEKSNRIMEVLLSAVSPRQLMVGKIIGQMGVGLLILLIYSGLGIGALFTFKLMDMLSTQNIIFLLVFFFIAFFLVASLMAAIGSAVTEVHEAQSLLGSVMLVFLVPWLLMPAIVQNPNSTLAIVLSMIPPVCPFVMVTRIAASTTPIPTWQIVVCVAVGLLSVAIAAWAAAKIFRIGVLMYGKPPNLWTLLKWVRMA